MKKSYVSLILTFVLASCAKEEMSLVPVEQTQEEQPLSYFMQEDDALAEAFNFFRHPMTKASAADIEPIDFSGETIAYYVNFPGGGWALVSADKRTQTILAYNETGTYEESDLQGPAQFWFKDICSDLYALKKDTTILKDSPHLAKWQRRDAIKTPVTRGGDEHENEWLQLVYTYRETYMNLDISHLIPTRWGEGSPWNDSAPFKDNTRTTRCRTGAAATALAQLMYYLHFEIGKPEETPTDSFNDGVYPNDLCYSGTDHLSSTAWNYMPMTISEAGASKPSIYVASLMAKINLYLRTNIMWHPINFNNDDNLPGYGTAGTSSILDYLHSEGINYNNSSYADFNPATVASQIQNDMPVLVTAYDSTPGSNNVLNCWLIDGVQTWDVYDTYYSQWMPRWTYPPVEPEEPDWNHPENYVISDPVLVNTYYFFRMNWGQDGLNDGTLYFYGERWAINNEYDFTSTCKMLYGFY